MDKKRVIVDYSTLPEDVLEIMANRYPDGYDKDIIKFPNAKGELISAVRVETDDTIFLVKVSKQLQQMVDDFETDDEDDDASDLTTDISRNMIPKGIIPDDELEEEEEDEEDVFSNEEELDEDEL
jgi:DNA-directed RNA polymerase subunit delta